MIMANEVLWFLVKFVIGMVLIVGIPVWLFFMFVMLDVISNGKANIRVRNENGIYVPRNARYLK